MRIDYIYFILFDVAVFAGVVDSEGKGSMRMYDGRQAADLGGR